MKKILIPTDFSLNSYQTIDYVTELFINEPCEFYFLNTYTYDVAGLNAIEMLFADKEYFDKPKEESLEQLGKLVERYTLKSTHIKHEFHAISECLNLVEAMKKYLEEINIDLVILTRKAVKTIGRNTEHILENIRTCPILLVPPHACAKDGVYLTIASDFKQKVTTNEINKFCKILANPNFKIGILVLQKQNSLSTRVRNNLESFINYLKEISNNPIGLEYIQPSYRLKDYAGTHLDGIMCIIDKKPDLLQKIGLYKSDIIPTLGQLASNTVLTIHE
ncbi:universal stress protein [Flavicella sediminum]|uniref:universal stress protein n=1 Tax=Flavicella sediminum TaxID=2585141 RepID=UPI0011220A62|nr:universal stress protein [Flavicella sediminum]